MTSIDDHADFITVKKALSILGFSEEEAGVRREREEGERGSFRAGRGREGRRESEEGGREREKRREGGARKEGREGE